jgi:circadian clock protein KaiC
MKRGLTVLKMRGSWHDKAIREFTIDKGGMQMGRAFRNVTGILAGTPVHVSPNDIERAWSQLDSDRGPQNPQTSGTEGKKAAQQPDRRRNG